METIIIITTQVAAVTAVFHSLIEETQV